MSKVTVKKHHTVNGEIITTKSFIDYVMNINESKVIDIHEGSNVVARFFIECVDGNFEYYAHHNGGNSISAFLRRLRPEVPIDVRKIKKVSFA